MNFELEYNSERSLMVIPEYGRHIQKLVTHCVALESKEERDTMAKAIVDVMGNSQPHLRDIPDFKHKLWDQLFIISDFKLDADAPYTKPSKEELQEKPDVLPYPKSASKYRFYGNNIQIMIDVVLTWEEGKKKDALIYAIGNHMKKCYLNWNKDTVDDSIIFNHIFELSGGNIDMRNSEEPLIKSKDLLRKRMAQQGNKSNKHKITNHKNINKKK